MKSITYLIMVVVHNSTILGHLIWLRFNSMTVFRPIKTHLPNSIVVVAQLHTILK